jgi:hypothetical protein
MVRIGAKYVGMSGGGRAMAIKRVVVEIDGVELVVLWGHQADCRLAPFAVESVVHEEGVAAQSIPANHGDSAVADIGRRVVDELISFPKGAIIASYDVRYVARRQRATVDAFEPHPYHLPIAGCAASAVHTSSAVCDGEIVE